MNNNSYLESSFGKQFLEQGFKPFLAPAKINLFLHVVGRRADGYHLIQSAFQLLNFYDTLYLKLRLDNKISRVNPVDGVEESQDLCVRAAKLLQQHTSCQKGIDIALEKRIPMGGGLGGGSSDAATVLLALNRLWQLNLSRKELMELGLKLGADVPFFIFGKNAWVEGIGEQLHAIFLNNQHFIVLTPPVNISTAEIFTHKELTRDTIPLTIAPFSRSVDINKLLRETDIHNDLEKVVLKSYPAVANCIVWLSKFSKSRMSGSGASVFAAFAHESDAQNVLGLKPKEYFGFVASGLSQHPLYNYAD